MIVKNESAVIKRCLDSVKEIIDYWVIIDTGSNDDTKEIIQSSLKNIPGILTDKAWVHFGHNRTELVQSAKNKADYLLLLDADMVVALDSNFDKNFDADGYMIRYNGNLDYAQQLLVRGNIDWEYIGVTHEYIQSDQCKTHKDLKSLRITHHADGNSHKNKFNRDIALLEKELKKELEPKDGRNVFYLAQSYRDIGDHKAAKSWYVRRTSMGGWDQEVWYAMYQSGEMYRILDQWEQALEWYLKAYSFRPSRAEPLYEIIVHYASRKNYQVAYLFANAAAKIPYPDDTLFVNKPLYDRLIKDQLAVCAYYVDKPHESRKICDELLDTPHDWNERDEPYTSTAYAKRIRENRTYAQNKIKQLVFGLGTGRCGTKSLQTLLNMQKGFSISHEAVVSPWIFDQEYLDKHIDRIQQYPGSVVGDVAFYHLNYVEQILKICPDAKFICLKRDKESTIQSYSSWTAGKNHWTDHRSKCWNPEKWKDDEYDDSYPKYLMPKRESIGAYWDDYYRHAFYLQRQYHRNFKLCPVNQLNTREGQLEILGFLGCKPNDMVLDVGIKKNARISVPSQKQTIWMFWDNVSAAPRPEYLDLCEESIRKHCSAFTVHVVNSNNVKDYLPDLREDWFDMTDVVYKSEYIRYKLLYEHGGIWLDSDLIVMNDLSPIMEKTSDFAATYPKDRNSQEPSSGLLASVPQGKTISRILNDANKKMEQKEIRWGDLGPQHLWSHVQNGYLALPPELCMPIRYQDHTQFTSTQDISSFYTEGMYCFMLYNVMFKKEKSRILSMNREELLEGDMLISQIFRKTLNICHQS